MDTPLDQTAIRAVVDVRDRTFQKNRIAFGNRLAAVSSGADKVDQQTHEILKRWHERFTQLEEEADKDIAALIEDVGIVQHMRKVRGIGPTLSAKMVSMIDITKADTVSALWRYAGYAVVNGQRERPVKGEKLHYNSRLKVTCYLVGTSMLRSNSPYRRVYDEARDFYASNRPDWTKAHCHQASIRKMVKVFLCHLWEQWRELEGLPVRELYVMEKMGHTHKITRAEMGWPPVK